VDVVAHRFDVFLTTLDPTVGSEIRKTRPCVVISPDEMNDYLRTVVVAPMTTQGRAFFVRVPCVFQGKAGLVLLDQVRTVDKTRLVKRLGKLAPAQAARVIATLGEMFTP
jgi:mRNA interferase MazF